MSLDPEASPLPVAVIGAGPIGLAAAAHLAERGVPFVVFELGDAVGSSIRQWAHVRLFSPWSFNIDAAARRLLNASGWTSPVESDHPTGGALVERYLEPLAALPEIDRALLANRSVVSVTRLGVDKVRTDGRDGRPFVVTTNGPSGQERTLARAIIDASGTWQRPNPLGADGRPALGEAAAADAIDYGSPDVLGADRGRYAERRIAVIGSGHSAQNAVRDLAALVDHHPSTDITWVIRRAGLAPGLGGQPGDALPERERLGTAARAAVASGRVRLETGFRIGEVGSTSGALVLLATDGRRLGPFDRLVGTTGSRPDLDLLSELRVDLDPALESTRALAPLIDPNVHTCGSVPRHGAAELAQPEPGLYVVGAKSYGRAPTFLLATGYEQVRSVVDMLAGGMDPVRHVHVPQLESGATSSVAALPVAGACAPAACAPLADAVAGCA